MGATEDEKMQGAIDLLINQGQLWKEMFFRSVILLYFRFYGPSIFFIISGRATEVGGAKSINQLINQSIRIRENTNKANGFNESVILLGMFAVHVTHLRL